MSRPGRNGSKPLPIPFTLNLIHLLCSTLAGIEYLQIFLFSRLASLLSFSRHQNQACPLSNYSPRKIHWKKPFELFWLVILYCPLPSKVRSPVRSGLSSAPITKLLISFGNEKASPILVLCWPIVYYFTYPSERWFLNRFLNDWWTTKDYCKFDKAKWHDTKDCF